MAASAQEPTGATADDPISMSLSGIIQTGSKSKFYTLTNTLFGVYVHPRYPNVLFAKDKNTNINKSEPTEAQVASGKIYDNVDDFDQSNWIKLQFPPGYPASNYLDKEIKGRSVTGQINVASAPAGPVGIYIDVNLDKQVPVINEASTFDGFEGNTYCCANFVQQDWFFVKPKNLEYCNIQWAVYNGNNMFYVPKVSSWPGSFKVDMALWEEQTDDNPVTADDVFQPGEAYQFPAIIQFSVDHQIGLNIDPGFDGDIIIGDDKAPYTKGVAVGQPGTLPEGYRNVMVYPLRLPENAIVTAVEQVETASEVESVQYFDLQGRMSNAPLRGVNIKVTTYTDGTTTREKLIH